MTPASDAVPAPELSRTQSVGKDLIAGMVVFLVALPLCLGIAHASGAPVIAGIISGILGGIVVGLLSGSHISVSGPAAGLAAIVIAALLVVRYRKSHDEGEVGVETRQIDLLSWSTASPTSFDPTGKDANGFVPANANSPTDSEVYDDDDRYAASIQGRLSPIEEDTQSRLEDCDINTPRHDHTLSQATPQGTKFVQMDFKRSIASIKASKEKAGKILGDLENMEGEWEGQLDSKVDAVAETPKQNNLEKFKVGSRVHQC